MKHVKMLGLAAVAAAALMAFIGASTASATVLCSTATNPCTSKYPAGTALSFSLKAGTSAKLVQTNGESLDTCTGSTVAGKVSNAGGAAATVSGPVETLTWSNCTFPTTTTQKGNLEVHYTSANNGTLTASSEFKVTIQTFFFGSCVYGVTAGTQLGTLAGGKPATFVANAVAKKLSGSEAACPETAKWTAEYQSTGATALYVEPS